MKLVKLLCLLTLCHVLVLAASPAFAKSLHSSIVFSQEYGGGYAWGMAWNYNTLSEARKRAVAECRRRGGTNCREFDWFRNASDALAFGDNSGFGSGSGTSNGAAEMHALKRCQYYNDNCGIAIFICLK